MVLVANGLFGVMLTRIGDTVPVCTESMAPVNCCEMVGTMTTPSAGEDDIARVTNRRDAASDGASN